MDWKDLLKIDLEEARKLTARHAPEEIEGFTPLSPKQISLKERFELNFDSWKHVLPKEKKMAGEQMLEGMKNKPEMFDNYANSFRQMFREHIVRNPESTSLIDRAKQANKENPRMGSAGYKGD